jgi:mono/diheme cytochrome c family protein
MQKKSKPFCRGGMIRPCKKIFLATAGILLISACGGVKKNPPWEYMPNMVDTPTVKAQAHPMRVPPVGTIPLGFEPYPFKKEQADAAAAAHIENPLPMTKDVLLTGQKVFNTYCIVCHGERGKGDGYIIPKFPRPPSLQSDKIRGWADGQIFHVITRGQNLMPSYATQIQPEDRWAIIRYVRALQRAEQPTPEDIEILKKDLKEGKVL